MLFNQGKFLNCPFDIGCERYHCRRHNWTFRDMLGGNFATLFTFNGIIELSLEGSVKKIQNALRCTIPCCTCFWSILENKIRQFSPQGNHARAPCALTETPVLTMWWLGLKVPQNLANLDHFSLRKALDRSKFGENSPKSTALTFRGWGVGPCQALESRLYTW